MSRGTKVELAEVGRPPFEVPDELPSIGAAEFEARRRELASLFGRADTAPSGLPMPCLIC